MPRVHAYLVAAEGTRPLSPIGRGWARTSVNATVFRKNAVVSHEGQHYAALYDGDGCLALAKRRLGSDAWQVRTTAYEGNVRDAHNAISIMVDGNGFLHVAWDHHDSPLRYARSLLPGSLELGAELAMLGTNETRVTYPKFHRLPSGDVLFLYRDGASGRGNVILNRYDPRAGSGRDSTMFSSTARVRVVRTGRRRQPGGHGYSGHVLLAAGSSPQAVGRHFVVYNYPPVLNNKTIMIHGANFRGVAIVSRVTGRPFGVVLQ